MKMKTDEAEREHMAIRAAGLVLRLNLWKRTAIPIVPQLSAQKDEQALAFLHESGVVKRRDGGLALTERGADWMDRMERSAYVGLGVFLGMPARSLAEPAGETAGQVTLTLLDGDLSFLRDLLKRTLPPVGHREYQRHRAMQEVVHAHLDDALNAIGDGAEEHDKTDSIKVAQMFGLVPYERGGTGQGAAS